MVTSAGTNRLNTADVSPDHLLPLLARDRTVVSCRITIGDPLYVRADALMLPLGSRGSVPSVV